MKVLYIILGLVAVIIIVVQIFAIRSRTNIESYPFKVVKKFQNFEVRDYESRLFTSVKLSTNEYKRASGNGFSKLGGYIFGANDKNEKIAMTSPVAMSLEDSMTMMFMVPKEYNEGNLPKPNQNDINFTNEPAKTVASITFGGWANDSKIEKYKQELINELEDAGIGYTKRFYLLGYNPPYDLFGRKNEIIVELEEGFTL